MYSEKKQQALAGEGSQSVQPSKPDGKMIGAKPKLMGKGGVKRSAPRLQARRRRSQIPAPQGDYLLHPKWPARMLPEQGAEELGFQADDIPILIRAGLLIPLGDPRRSSVKRFAREEILALGRDAEWLHRATLAIENYWRTKKNRI